jgi:hypothetical protein
MKNEKALHFNGQSWANENVLSLFALTPNRAKESNPQTAILSNPSHLKVPFTLAIFALCSRHFPSELLLGHDSKLTPQAITEFVGPQSRRGRVQNPELNSVNC